MMTRFLPLMMIAFLAGCTKVPLREHRGHFDLATSHWFENEKTQYIFFSVDGLRDGQAKTTWPAEFEIARESGEFSRLNLSTAVHAHRLVECGVGRICGSFSFKAEKPVDSLALRYRYHVDSPISESIAVSVSKHRAGAGSESQSALVYGVFNGDNSRVQVRVHDNFGSPDSTQIKHYGMTRKFAVESLVLANVPIARLRTFDDGAFHFPSQACDSLLPSAQTNTEEFSGVEAWMKTPLSPNDRKDSACFRVKALDQKGVALNQAAALARRNPEFSQGSLSIRTPLQDAQKVPIVFGYCAGRPESDGIFSAPFFEYQRFILGMPPYAGVDACFAVGEEDRFARDVERVINQRLAEARAQSQGTRDLFFTVAINARLSSQILEFRKIIALKLAERIRAENGLISPRLVGAFVYDSQAADPEVAGVNQQIVWCPRLEKPGQDESEANCTPRAIGDVNIGPFNFLIPMGPFPTLDLFVHYQNKYGDSGRTREPEFQIRAVTTNQNSVSDQANDQLFTFFDGHRLELAQGERLRFCRDRDDTNVLDKLVFREGQVRGRSPVINLDQAQSRLDHGQTNTLNVGIRWQSPFIGAFSYRSPIEGKVLKFIPFSTSVANKQQLGDETWNRPRWDIGALTQKCLRYCEQPFFDEAGIYQLKEIWTEAGRCPNPRIPEPNE